MNKISIHYTRALGGRTQKPYHNENFDFVIEWKPKAKEKVSQGFCTSKKCEYYPVHHPFHLKPNKRTLDNNPSTKIYGHTYKSK